MSPQSEVFEAGDTIQFTWTASLAPDAAPGFMVWDRVGSLLNSVTAIQSDALHYSSLWTMPNSPEWYLYEWRAEKTIAGSVWPFVTRGVFRVELTQITQPGP